MRLALQTHTPIVPVGVVGSEEQSPGLVDATSIGRLIGAPAFPITATFPWLGLLGFLPLPVKYRYYFGEPILFEHIPNPECPEDTTAFLRRAVDRLAPGDEAQWSACRTNKKVRVGA